MILFSNELSRILHSEIDIIARFDILGLENISIGVDIPLVNKLFKNSKSEIKILNTYLPFIVDLEDGIQQAVDNGCVIKILLLDPESQFASKRGETIGFKDPTTVSRWIHNNIEEIGRIREKCHNPQNIELRLFDRLPIISLIGIGEKTIIGFFLEKVASFKGPNIELIYKEGGVAEYFINHFNEIWDRSKPYSFLSNSKEFKQ